MNDEGRDNQDGLMSLLLGIGVGVVLGGVVALLLAPQPGEQTRAQLRGSVDDALGRLRDSMDDLRVKVEEATTSAREAVSGRAHAGVRQGDVAGATDAPGVG